MAKRLDNFEFPRPPGRSPKYPWDEWLDGFAWRLTRGEDFVPTSESFRSMAYDAAELRGLKCQTKIDGDSLTIQARPKDTETDGVQA